MARRTKAVSNQVLRPFNPSNARFQARLIDFDTDSARLEAQHEAFLRNSMNEARLSSAFHVRLFGFASRLGSTEHNHALALRRMNSVVSFLQAIDQNTLANIEGFQNFGESTSGNREEDDSPEFRAVEVHIFIGSIPPPPVSPDNKRVPIEPLPLPGGRRSANWRIAIPGGFAIAEGLAGGFNVFLIENVAERDLRGYFQPALGGGLALSLSGLKLIGRVIQRIITGAQGSPPVFRDVVPAFPTTFAEVEACMVTVASAGAGIGKGVSVARVTFSGQVHHHGPSGFPIRTAEDIFKFTAAGENFQLGLGGTVLIGPLFRVS